MNQWKRIRAVYRKELIDILRDRRTLIAMVVIPVVLYPLLLLGFLRLAESEESRLRAERFVVEVGDEPTRQWLVEVISKVRSADEKKDKDQADFDVRVGTTSPEMLGDETQLRISRLVTPGDKMPDLPPRVGVRVVYNEVNVHSRAAMEELTGVFNRLRTLLTRESLGAFLGDATGHRPSEAQVELLLDPISVDTVSVATNRQRGGWALGQIVPIILVLMTITGAIHPAIDLTAGERERGTLETLMTTPVPVLHLIMGKFLVVATVGMLTAALNVASVGATMHFGGLTRAITSELPVTIPLSVLPIVLLCMIPFALLFAAVLVAVCSFARTFKEAQNYAMPVVLAAMIPAVAVTLPTVRLQGVLLVVPVGNMVLLARELFQQTYTWSQVGIVILSTLLYAAAAVAVAVRLFGQEAVVFADASSYRALMRRRFFRPMPAPTVSQALLLAALLFPASFFANTQLGTRADGDIVWMLRWLAVVQFAGLFILVPSLVAVYFKINPASAFRLRMPPARAWLAAILLGGSSWAISHELLLLQQTFLPPSPALVESLDQIEARLTSSPLWLVLLLLAVVPALSEEFLFRGFVLSGLRGGMSKWPAIVTCSLVFGVYHFMIDKVPITAALGILLGYLCWQAQSLWPGVVFHALHNGVLTGLLMGAPDVSQRWLGLSPQTTTAHLPAHILIPAAVMLAAALAILASLRRGQRT